MASVFLVFALLGISRVSAQAIGSMGGVVTPNEHHKHLDGCLLPNKELMPFNETRSLPERCLQVTCLPDRTIGYQHCEPVLVPQECSQTDYNNTLPYPQCCPVMICENSNSTVQNETDSTAKNTTDIASNSTTILSDIASNSTTILSDIASNSTTTLSDIASNSTTILSDKASNSTTISINTPSNSTISTSSGGVTHIQKIRAVKRNTNNIQNQTTIK